MPASSRNSATRCSTVDLRWRVARGKTALTDGVVSLEAHLARAASSIHLSTMTPRGHGASREACLGHQEMHRRRRRTDMPAANAVLPFVSACRKRVRRSDDESNMVLSKPLVAALGM